MNPIPVAACSIGVITVPPQGGAVFSFEVIVTFQNQQRLQLRVPTLDEFMAIAAVLQIPGGQLMFQPAGQVLFKNF
ncbi:MAG TPA: hypothetical protein VMB03_20870 [Bryobacteraceae bacterium]|nr:hypothetical protein [Bryobacteraceae bacterium]